MTRKSRTLEKPRWGKKLHSTQVEQIKDILSIMGRRVNITALARDYGVNQSLIYQIRKNEIWRDI